MKKNFKLLRTILFVFSILCFLIFVLSGIYIFLSGNDNSWILSVSIALINFLITSILSFINLVVLPKKFKGTAPIDKFSDRKEIIQKIFQEINNENRIIKITGHPLSGKSELLKYLYKIITNKKFLLEAGIDKKLAEKVYQNIGCVHYIDSELFLGKLQKLINDIDNLSYSKYKKTIILLDNIYKTNNSYNVLERLFAKEKKKISVIYTINYYDINAFYINEFNHNDIYELALKYDLRLSFDEINNIYLSTQGNIGLISLILSNFNSQNYIKSLNSVDDNEISIKAQDIIEAILYDNKLKKIAILCATLNFCENTFDSSKLSKIMGYNISSLDLTKLHATGLFSHKNNIYYSSDYISQIIRSIDYELVNQFIPKLIKYYHYNGNHKAISILLLCKGELSEQEAIQIKTTLTQHLINIDSANLAYLMKIGQAYKEINSLDLTLSKKHEELREEIIYQYANALIYVGDYKAADKTIGYNSSDRLLFAKADLAHLQNDYDTAIGLFTIIINNHSSNFHMAKIKLAHCYKHKGHFTEALEMLVNIEQQKDSPLHIKLRSKTDSLSLYILLKNFSGLYNKIQEIKSNSSQLKDYQIATLKRYNAVLLAYKKQYDMAITEINQAIKICNKTDSRLRYNCYYIRGEINRHFKKYEQAFNDFLQCFRVTLWNEDYNLKSMSVLSLELIKNEIDNDMPDYDIPELLKICDQNNMPYNSGLLTILIQHQTLSRPFSDKLKNTYFIVP